MSQRPEPLALLVGLEERGLSVRHGLPRPGGLIVEAAEEGEHVRTTTGYARADGEPVHRVSIMLTKAQRRRLRDLAEDEGVSRTGLVVRVLRL